MRIRADNLVEVQQFCQKWFEVLIQVSNGSSSRDGSKMLHVRYTTGKL